MVRSFAVVVAVALLAVALPLDAQQSPTPIKRTVLQRVDVPGTTSMEAVMDSAEKGKLLASPAP